MAPGILIVVNPTSALLVVGRFEEDVAVVRSSTARLVGCVAAGIPAFLEPPGLPPRECSAPSSGCRPPTARGRPFGYGVSRALPGATRMTPSYVAAQAAATGYLAAS